MTTEIAVYIIAEAGVNHNGSEELAKKMIDCAADAGANAVKFQSFSADRLVAKSAPSAEYQIAGMGEEKSQWQMLKNLEMSDAMQEELARYAVNRNIDFLSTPFDTQSLQTLLKTTSMPRVKVASGEITNAPLLLRVALTGLPVILSTGMCTLGEIEDALSVLAFGYQTGIDRPVSANSFKDAYCDPAAREQLSKLVTLLHCTSQYPTEYENVNLRAMQTMAASFGLPVGYSDHTMGIAISCAAVAMGATMLEKHFTLDRSYKGPDHKMSLEPGELKSLVQAVREIEVALGSSFKYPTPGEVALKPLVRKGLFAITSIQKGEVFTSDNLASKRPEGPLSPRDLWNVLGKRAGRSYSSDEAICGDFDIS